MKIQEIKYNMENLEIDNFEYENNYITLTSFKVILF